MKKSVVTMARGRVYFSVADETRAFCGGLELVAISLATIFHLNSSEHDSCLG
jgi:hypothetical protein